jgi:hypothetical protein
MTRRWKIRLFIGAATVALACMGTGVVTSKTDQGGHGATINVCVKPDNGDKATCDNFTKDQVKNCHVGSHWPECKEKSD